MELRFEPMDIDRASAIVGWRYTQPYELYNSDPAAADETIRWLTDPQNAYFSILADDGVLLAFCCFGADAQVPGGDYSAPALDIGFGLRPDLTGQRRSRELIPPVLEFARRRLHAGQLRVTVAEFNQRAVRAWKRAGFEQHASFTATGSDLRFVILQRAA